MVTTPHPGRTEIGMLADMREVAERIGEEVLGFPIRWLNEERTTQTGKKPDLLITKDETNEPLVCLEAKRPDDPKGATSTVASEVEDALGKAVNEGAPLAATTNFFDIALHDALGAGPWMHRLIGAPIQLVDPRNASTQNWWRNLTRPQLATLLERGLRHFFETIKSALASKVPPSSATDMNEVVLAIFKRTTDRLVNDLAPTLVREAEAHTLTTAVGEWAKGRGFTLTDPADARYMAAQSVAEVLTSCLFYRNIQSYFSLEPILRGVVPKDSQTLRGMLLASLSDATTRSGDYETIFTLSPAAHWALGSESFLVLTQWRNLVATVEALQFNEIDAEVIGVIFERLISPEQRRVMGQHYTQTRIARVMSEWAVENSDTVVADFSCGAGTFLVEGYNILRRKGLSHQEALQQVFGNDLDSFATHLATINLATRDVYQGHNFPAISNRDAFTLRPNQTIVEVTPFNGERVEIVLPSTKLTAVVGNPPYDEKAPDAKFIISELTSLRRLPIEPTGLPENINFAAWFILLATAWTDGRIALVLPSAILQNSKHEKLREWMRRRYDLTFWHTDSDVWFSDARVSSFVLLASPRAQTRGEFGRQHYVDVRERVTGSLCYREGVPTPEGDLVVRDISMISGTADPLMEGSVPEPLTIFEAGENVEPLYGLAVNAYRGNKLGSPLYRLRDKDPSSSKLVREVEGKDLSLNLSSRYLLPLFRSPKDELTGEFSSEKPEWWVLAAPEKLPRGGDLKKYVDFLKRSNYADAPSVRAKGEAWWSVDWKKSRVAIQVHPQFKHQVWWSDVEFISTDNFQCLEFPQDYSAEDQELVAASLGSAFGALAGLFMSHEVGCEGVRWVATEHVERWPVLNPQKVKGAARERVLEAFRAHRKLKVVKAYELPQAAEESLWDLTRAVAAASGADASDAKNIADAACAEVVATTRRRREREKLAVRGRTRMGASGGRVMEKSVREWVAQYPEADALVSGLSNGTVERKLRRMSENGDQISLDLGMDNAISDVSPDEDVMAKILGEDFLCAPDVNLNLRRAVEGWESALMAHFIVMDESGAVVSGYEGVASEVKATAIKALQRMVIARLT